MIPEIAAFCFLAVAIAWCGAAEAKTGLAPVVVDASLGVVYSRAVGSAIRDALRLNGVDPPPSGKISARLGPSFPKKAPSTAQCVAAGKDLGLDLLLLIRIRNLDSGTRLQTELRAVVVETGEDRRYEQQTLIPDTERRPVRLVVAAAKSLLQEVVEEVRAQEPDLAGVEQALHRDCDEDYAEYRIAGAAKEIAFADHMYLEADKRMRDGKVVAIAIPTVLIAITTTVLLAGFKPWTWDDEEDGSDPNGMGSGFIELFRNFGFVLVAIVGYGASIATLIGGIHMYSEGKEDVGRLRPLVPIPPKRAEPEVELAFAPYASPSGGGLALDLRF